MARHWKEDRAERHIRYEPLSVDEVLRLWRETRARPGVLISLEHGMAGLRVSMYLQDRGEDGRAALLAGDEGEVEMLADWLSRHPRRVNYAPPEHRDRRPIGLKDAATVAGKSLRALQHAAKRGTLKCYRYEGRWVTTLADVEDYLYEQARDVRGRSTV